MDLHFKREISVGAFVMVGVALFTFGMMWLSGKSLNRSNLVDVPVRFSNVRGLRSGDPVQISGVKVGRVENVILQGVDQVLVVLSVEQKVRPHTDARAGVASADFFGAKFVDYSPGIAPELLEPGQPITGSREVALAEGASDLTSRAGDLLTSAQALLGPRTADDVHQTMVAAQRALTILADLGQGPAVKEATATMEQLRRVSGRLDSVLANPSITRSVNQLDELTASVNDMTRKLSSATQSLTQIMKKLDSGQGTLGRMINDTTTFHDLHELSQSMTKLMNDMRERPGRYFNVKVF